MSISSVVIISLAAAVILVIGGGLLMYMSNLVKNAYELKVQIGADIDARLGKMSEDLDKKSRWIKRDLIEEIEKIKVALETENGRKFEALALSLNDSVEGLNAQIKRDRTEWSAAIERDRLLIAQLDSRIDALRDDLKKTTSSPLAAALAKDPASPGDPAAAEPAAATVPTQPDSRTMSQFLPDLSRKR